MPKGLSITETWSRRVNDLEAVVSRLRARLNEAELECRRYEAECLLKDSIIDCSESLICVLDKGGRVLVWNRAAEQITGYGRGDVLGTQRVVKWLFPQRSERRQLLQAASDLTRQGRGLENYETEIACKDGMRRNISWNARVLQPEPNAGQVMLLVGRDVTDLRLSQLKMEQLAFYDTLTELPNRRLFRDRLNQAIESARRKGGRVAVMFLDLDRFKRINDSLGHEAGDDLLRQVARRLVSCVRSQDTVARLGGDEFTVLLPDINDAATASVVAAKISEVLQLPIRLGSQEVLVTGSVGISIAPDDSTDVLTLLRNADLAMYRAKEKGRNTFQYFTDELNQLMDRQMLLESELRVALRKKQFHVHYQPIYTLDRVNIVGLEALLRWNHPTRGTIFPEEFFGILEETGLIMELASWILEQACVGAARIHRTIGPIPVAVNLSARQFSDGELARQVRHALDKARLQPQLLQLEISEGILMDDVEYAIATMTELKQQEVILCIDDFGAGQSSLRYLTEFPVDCIKVDRRFIHNIPDIAKDMAITGAIIAMAHKLDFTVIAEGVETEEQVKFLQDSQCDQMQGNYCSVPLDQEGLYYLLKVGTPGE